MSEIRICDVEGCKKQIAAQDALEVAIVFDRTPEEITQLMAAQDAPDCPHARLAVREVSAVSKELDMCRSCYDDFKQKYGQ